MAEYFTKTRNPTPHAKWNPATKPYAAHLARCLDAMKRGAFYECLLQCAALEETHGPTPWTQMLAMLIKKDRLGMRDEALADAKLMTENYPGWVDAQYNYGAFLQELGRWDDALWHLRKALQIDEEHVPSMVQLGICYTAQGNHDAAWRVWDEALRYQPLSVRDEYHLGPIFAARGNMAQFMRLQELRWEAQEHYTHDHGLPPHILNTAEIWQGEDLQGHSILVMDEQGAGDTIQFARYLTPLCDLADSVWLRLKQPSLRTLIEAIEPRVNVVMVGEPLPLVTRVVGLMSLFHRLAMVRRHDPAFPQNYVPEDPAPTTPRTFGICWAGATSHPRDAQRSMTWEDVQPLLDAFPDVQWVDFTIGRSRPDHPRVSTIRPADYLDSCGLLNSVSALVTVDTSVAHLAGAMGIPTHVLVTTLPDMRWGVQGDTTPWYESWTLVRQEQPNDWSPCVQRVIAQLREG